MANAGRPLVVIAGSVAQRPNRGGHAWVFLQYVLGFRRLGWDVLFLDRLTEDMVPAEGDATQPALSFWPSVDWFLKVVRRGAVGDGYSLALPGGGRLGLDRAEVLRRTHRSSFLLDVNGFLNDEEISAAARLRVFLDIDPGFNQMWHELGLANVLAGFDAYVTTAQRMGQPDCLIPTCGRSWITTLPPVVLEAWPVAPPRPDGAFTSIATWRGPFEPVEFQGDRYGLRVHEFRRFASVAANSGERFELALDIDAADHVDIAMLAHQGWQLIDPMIATSTLAAYQDFINASKAEFAVAKQMYVKTRSGWISDRTVCYLASGRPVIVQDTGQRAVLGGSDGISIFGSIEEAIALIRDIAENHTARAQIARMLAEQRFDSDIVLPALLSNLSLTNRMS